MWSKKSCKHSLWTGAFTKQGSKHFVINNPVIRNQDELGWPRTPKHYQHSDKINELNHRNY